MIKIRPLPVMATLIGRQTRWCGSTGKYWWSVLHHSFLVENIVSDITEDKKLRVRDAARLYALIHNLHEAVTNDIPSPLKSQRIRSCQEEIDQRLYELMQVPEPPTQYKSFVKQADLRAMWAEACVLQDPYINPEHVFPVLNTEKREVEYAPADQRRDKAHVRAILEQYGSATMTQSIYSRGVQDYVEQVMAAVANVRRLTEDHYSRQSPYLRGIKLDVAPFIPNPEPEEVAA